jgi:hypothetical protein
LNGGETWDFAIGGRPPAEPGKNPTGSIRWVGGNYFETLGISLKRGRLFAATDDARAPRVVIVNEALAALYFPGVDPLGQMILRGNDSLRIVGVVGNVPIAKLEDRSIATWYVRWRRRRKGSCELPCAALGRAAISFASYPPNSASLTRTAPLSTR